MENERQQIGLLFDRIARTYDVLNHLLSLNIDTWWRRKAVRQMGEHERVLDVAIGTADLTVELLRSGKAKMVTGIDLSEQMMAIGKAKVAKRQWADKVTFCSGSALDMPFADGSFEAVSCAYGVRNFSDTMRGLREMRRVLERGGELLILEFSYPKNRLVRGLYDFYFSKILPWVGNTFSRDADAYTYLNRSVKQFAYGETFCGMLREAGFVEVRATELTFGITTIYHAYADGRSA